MQPEVLVHKQDCLQEKNIFKVNYKLLVSAFVMKKKFKKKKFIMKQKKFVKNLNVMFWIDLRLLHMMIM